MSGIKRVNYQLVCYPLHRTRVQGTGCTLCRRACPQKAIAGEKKQLHVIDQDLCDRCGVCYQSCKFDTIDVA